MAPILDLGRAHVVDGSQWKPTQKGRCSPISLKICIPRRQVEFCDALLLLWKPT